LEKKGRSFEKFLPDGAGVRFAFLRDNPEIGSAIFVSPIARFFACVADSPSLNSYRTPDLRFKVGRFSFNAAWPATWPGFAC
jgi:hypothetical protein